MVIADNAGNDTRIYPIRTATGKVVQERMALYFTNKNPKTVRMDNALHFKNAYVLDFLEGVGAQVIFSIPYKPETNGVAERAVRSAKYTSGQTRRNSGIHQRNLRK